MSNNIFNNEYHAHCRRCNTYQPIAIMVKGYSPSRGGRPQYQCERCAVINEGYGSGNNRTTGTEKVHEMRCGVELETSFSTYQARVQLFDYDFSATHDGSLDADEHERRYVTEYGTNDWTTCEYISPLWNGFNIASKWAVSVDKLMANGQLAANDSCGTHFHVSVNNMKDAYGDHTYMGYIREYYVDIFRPLSNEIASNPALAEKVFGRYFSEEYAKPIRFGARQRWHDDRYYFINCMADNNIEFRLNKFVSAKQYQNIMRMEIDMVHAIIANFCEHYNKVPNDRRRYPSQTEYRRHKAETAANKLVKLYRKYSANI